MYILILTVLTTLVGQSSSNGVRNTYSNNPDLESLKLQVQRLFDLRQEDRQKIQHLEGLYISERNERLALEKSLAKLQYSPKMSSANLARGTRAGHPVFAFHVGLSKDFIATRANQAIPFDRVPVDKPNLHPHYNTTTGTYRCVMEGIYFFSWTIGATGQGSFAETSLVKNDDWMGMLIAYNNYASSGSSAIMHLDIGDTVSIRVSTNSSVLRDVSTFSGFMLMD